MPRKRHPDRDIEKALQYAERRGWRIEVSSGHAHAWGRMFCPGEGAQCKWRKYRIVSIASTPRSTGDHAAHIRHIVERCLGDCEASRRNED